MITAAEARSIRLSNIETKIIEACHDLKTSIEVKGLDKDSVMKLVANGYKVTSALEETYHRID